jgi:type II secretory pathway component GspD/PulD (secretin)
MCLVLGLLALAAVSALLWAPAFAAEADKSARPSGSADIRPTTKADLFEVDASDVDVKFVLEALARRSGANIVVSPDVAGMANAHLKGVTVEAVLDYLSTAQGFKWEKRGGTYVVAGNEQLAKPTPVSDQPPPPAPETLIWDCRNIEPQGTVTTLKGLLPSLIVVGAPDHVTPIISAGQASNAGPGQATTSSTTNSKGNSTKIIVIGPPADVARARDLLNSLDVGRKQVSLQVSITELTSTGSKEIGVDWTWTDASFTEDNASGISFGKFTKSNMTINAAISALVEDGKANLLAQPNIAVVDNESASILIGDRILYPKLIGYSQVGTPIYDKEEEDVGIQLQIAPKIAGDQIILTLHPQVSLITGYLQTQAGDYPQISTREAQTTVAVKNGATLAIGGLLRDNDITSISKFPILSEIPILGHLFRHTKKSTERTEILILVTPKIVDGTVAHAPTGG